MKIWLLLITLFLSCNHNQAAQKRVVLNPKQTQAKKRVQAIINPDGMTIQTRIHVPEGFERVSFKKGSYGYYLRNLPLKKHGMKALYFDGDYKPSKNIYCAVVNWDLGNKDLQQCADAAMRLRGEYLFDKGLYKQIRFNFLKDGKPRYYKKFASKYNRKTFTEYLDFVFLYANTRSLYKQLKKAKWSNLTSGDVLIQVGKPFGHAVTVMDVAIHKVTGEKIFLLSQSYMPAQDIQILINPGDKKKSPWYSTKIKDKKGRIITPEWYFKKRDLRRF